MEDQINEVVEVSEQVTNGKNGLITELVIGGSAVAGAFLWNLVLKPIGKKVKGKIAERAAKKAKVVDSVPDKAKPTK